MRIACIGEAMIELALQGDTAAVGVAGDTLNTAIYLHRSAPGLQVDYVTRLGDCSFSERIRTFIAAQGVGVSQVQMMPGRSPGLYAITTRNDGERSFSYWRENAAARTLFEGNDFSVLDAYDALYLSGISLAILPHSVRLALVDWLGQSNVQLIYDSNFRSRLWDDMENARQITDAMWQRADIALPSIDDEMALFEQTGPEVVARFARFEGIGALKRGEAGPISLGETVDQFYPASKRVVDTTAAGDSFNGGYLGRILTGASQAEALRAGHELASKVVQYRGAIIPA
ncbi:MAG: sugar kinase [Sulfitobacter sp.]